MVRYKPIVSGRHCLGSHCILWARSNAFLVGSHCISLSQSNASRVSSHCYDCMSLSRSNSLRLLSFHVQRTQLQTTLVLAYLGGFTVNCELFQNYRSNRAMWLGTYKDWNSI